MHKRLSIQSLIIANYRPKSTICQDLYTFVEEVDFTRKWEVCGGLSDCEELVGVTWRLSDCEELVGVTHRR